jgi:hypothetical protein
MRVPGKVSVLSRFATGRLSGSLEIVDHDRSETYYEALAGSEGALVTRGLGGSGSARTVEGEDTEQPFSKFRNVALPSLSFLETGQCGLGLSSAVEESWGPPVKCNVTESRERD